MSRGSAGLDGAQRLGPDGNGAQRCWCQLPQSSQRVDDGARWQWCQHLMGRDGDGTRRLGPGGDGRNGDGRACLVEALGLMGRDSDGARRLGPDGNGARRGWCRLPQSSGRVDDGARRQWCRPPQSERPGRIADPLSLVVDITSWYDEEQLRLVKGTN